ncbi:TetR family transcriptional regulator [Streptacidiphilus sp. N1-12]|uniref:TetR family transcriptional regulator n=2 Tax=Streptacidiphilus alkalitolerans TaxID=3342712 RepID=A0ABV6WAK0_9ACTN
MAQQFATPADRRAGPAAGLRQRKKQRTRDELLGAAQQLFLRQGYARTTVDEITAVVDVSQRTFFRYFANKEQVALALMANGADDLIEFLRARPSEENPLQALRAATRETWRSRVVPGQEPASANAALEIFHLVESTPTLLAAHLHRLAEQELLIAAVLAEREGIDPASDLRPRLLAAVFGAVARSAQRQWTATAGGVGADGAADAQNAGADGFLPILECHLDQLGPALTANWR